MAAPTKHTADLRFTPSELLGVVFVPNEPYLHWVHGMMKFPKLTAKIVEDDVFEFFEMIDACIKAGM